jgi:uncharacterized protein YgiM (DUF1202 family)
MALAPKRTLIIGGGLAAVLILYALGAKNQPKDNNSSQPTANASQCVVAVTADDTLNIRATPGRDGKIVGKLAKGKQVNADKVVQNGFRKLSDNQWVSVDFAKPVQGHDCG